MAGAVNVPEWAQFAAARDGQQDSLIDLITPEVADALAAGQFHVRILTALRPLFAEVYEAEGGTTLSRAWWRWAKDMRPTLRRTKDDGSETQVTRLATWLATALLNGATRYAAGRQATKTWLSMRDEHVRATHRTLHAATVGLGEKFTVGQTEVDYPGQPVGPPEVWINCRCHLWIKEEAMTASAGPTNGRQACIVALPAEDDPIRAASSEPVAHLTMLYLGEDVPEDVITQIGDAVMGVSEAVIGPMSLAVTGRQTLGDEGADVVLLDGAPIMAAREALLANQTVRAAFEAVKQFPTWTPHVTLGYPDTPAAGEYAEQAVTFDRLALWTSDYDGPTFTMATAPEGDVAASAEEPAGEEPIDDEGDDTDELDPEGFISEADVEQGPVPWHGVLAVERTMTGDRRQFDCELTWREPPLPLLAIERSGQGHENAVVVGQVAQLWRDGNLVRGRGWFASLPEADKVIGLVAERHLRGVSVDIDRASVADSDMPEVQDEYTSFTEARIAGVTIAPIPAFAEAYIALGPGPFEPPGSEGLAADGAPGRLKNGSAPQCAYCKSTATRYVLHAEGMAFIPACDEHLPKARDDAEMASPDGTRDPGNINRIGEYAITFAPGTKDGPGWITNPVATARIRRYWVHGKGAAKIRWGQPHDFYRCRRQLAKYVQNPEWLNGLCANMHKEALGIWPGEHDGPMAAQVEMGCTDCLDALHAAAAAPIAHVAAPAARTLPASWFSDPSLTRPTPLTITDEGRVYGHLAAWGTCHIGIQGTCITPPKSTTDYAYYRVGAVMTDAGEVPVGHITMGTGHASTDPSMSARAAAAHYDNTGSVVADVASGEDAYGIWVAGAMRPTATPDQVAALRAAALSGDWRRIGGSLELVAALAVNVPGFPIPRGAAFSIQLGAQASLVAAGIVSPRGTDSAPGAAPDTAAARNLRQNEVRRRALALRAQVALSR